MSDTVIRVENLSKVYQIRHEQAERYTALRDVLANGVKNTGKKFFSFFSHNGTGSNNGSHPFREDFHALKDVSFEVKAGERVGIIGRNGAGKSTLLKILSRVTEPTAGRVGIKGRVASLLEVGTGFHPELTGRENIFLNGAILGMTKVEIKKKFDEIVAFAEVEKFLDTPVKRYSSGMYVRLAFAVAAHLEPEILVVDEVLAVGDAAFQAKCLGKMEDVAKQGRAILFVSHNMGAVLRLCECAVLLDLGNLLTKDRVAPVVERYLCAGTEQDEVVNLGASPRGGEFGGRALLAGARLIGEDRIGDWQLPYSRQISLKIDVEVLQNLPALELGLALKTATGFELASTLSSYSLSRSPFAIGKHSFYVTYRDITLVPGRYRFGLGLRSDRGFEDYLPEAFELEIVDSEDSANKKTETLHGVIVPIVHYEVVSEHDSSTG
ncbi:MAG: polysaccharide ABC transporter ATP-binding protein [Syntrophobacteraceae bacterium]